MKSTITIHGDLIVTKTFENGRHFSVTARTLPIPLDDNPEAVMKMLLNRARAAHQRVAATTYLDDPAKEEP